MNKLQIIITILLIQSTFVKASGKPVTCGNGRNCNSCADNDDARANFSPITWTQCQYYKCNQPTAYINSLICQSCYQAPDSIPALNVGNFYNPSTSACVLSCPNGTIADNTNTCVPNTKPGNNVSCGLSGSCSGCGASTEIQNLFTPVSGSNCKVTDCSKSPSSYNSYVCQSCYQANGAVAALNIGNFYDPGTNKCVPSCPNGTIADNTNTCQPIPTKPGTNKCVSSCPNGTIADNTNTCQPIPTKPGNNVLCGSSGSCSGCGASTEIQNLFSPVSGSNCKVTDCSKSPSSYNSYVCQSCYQANGAVAALNIGNFYDPGTNKCVPSCPNGTIADNTNTCQPIPTKPGNNVSCGSSGSCSGCGASTEIQNLFSPVSGSNCKVTDCSLSPSLYNSYVCQSCYQASGSIAALNIGNYYDPVKSACVASCPKGTAADNTNTCQPISSKPDNASCSSNGAFLEEEMNKLNTIIITLFIIITFVRAQGGNRVNCSNGSNCNLCADTDLYRQNFMKVSSTQCVYMTCNQSTYINSFICQSCYQVASSVSALNVGNFYNPATNACVSSCPLGTTADNTNTCQPNTKPGNNVSCGSSGGCSGCGATNQIQSLFTPVSGSNCKVTDCSQSPSSYNSYVCQSCYQASGSIVALNIGNYYDPVKSSCVYSCPLGTMADSTNTCQTIPTKPGNNVSCGNSGSCLGCGAAPQIQNLFTPVSGSNCKVADCSQSPISYNGYVCQSCYQASGSIAALNIGNYYDSIKSACVSSCPTGTTADNTNICQPNPTQPNNNVQCSSSGNFQEEEMNKLNTIIITLFISTTFVRALGNLVTCGNGSNCNSCGDTTQITSNFSPFTFTQCLYTACDKPTTYINSLVCQSCYKAPGSITALNVGNFYNPATNACVSSCPLGTLADNTNTCQIIPTKPGNNISCGSSDYSYQIIPTKPGNNVSCGSSGSCSGCGAVPQIQNLFTPVSGSNCKVTDCSQSPSQYNGYVCQSCYQASGSIAALNIGNYYDSIKSSCVSSCPTGTTADNTNTCQPNPTQPNNNVQCSSSGNCKGQNLYTSGNFLNLTLCFLLLSVLI
ncbi:hypothetical protein ABPG73_004506 [Tetrahymena malaccensis]